MIQARGNTANDRQSDRLEQELTPQELTPKTHPGSRSAGIICAVQSSVRQKSQDTATDRADKTYLCL